MSLVQCTQTRLVLLVFGIFAGTVQTAFSADDRALPPFAFSSFQGLNIDVDGVRLDLPIRESLLGINPNYRFKQGKWKDSQGGSKRAQTGLQNYAKGNIRGIRESVAITPIPWHSGEYIQRLKREVKIKPDDQMPTIDGFKKAVVGKYGPATHLGTKSSQLSFMSSYSEEFLVYTIKNGSIRKTDCWDANLNPFTLNTYNNEKASHYDGMLQKIQAGWCDAILVHFYTTDNRNRDRIRRYGSYVRDFRLEAEAFIEDLKQKKAATKRRQDNTPAGQTKL